MPYPRSCPICLVHALPQVQDLTPAQLALFKFVCLAPETGLLLAGDTAQTIERGTNFRFEVIRALVYKEFRGGLVSAPADEGSEVRQGNVGTPRVSAGVGGKRKPPAGEGVTVDMFQLVENYRTHDRIVKLASSLVKALMHFFPDSVDKLKPEMSKIDGKADSLFNAGLPRPFLSPYNALAMHRRRQAPGVHHR